MKFKDPFPITYNAYEHGHSAFAGFLEGYAKEMKKFKQKENRKLKKKRK
jgi:uncharacterized protein YeaO (DUF488 family)